MPKWKHTKDNLSWTEFSCTVEKLWFTSYPWGLIHLRNFSKEIMPTTWCTEYRPRNKTKTDYSLWFFHSLTMPPRRALCCSGTHGKQRYRPRGPAHSMVRIRAWCMWKFFGIYRQGYKTMPFGWMERTHCIKESEWTFRDKETIRSLLWVHPYFFSFISLHFKVTA